MTTLDFVITSITRANSKGDNGQLDDKKSPENVHLSTYFEINN